MRTHALALAALSWTLLSPHPTRGQGQPTILVLEKTYQDESHCLVAPEIRGAADKPISCFCRDALADARYVYQTYLITKKDKNLNGVYLTLEQFASQVCGEHYDISRAAMEVWQWNGPEVTRTYPPDTVIEQLKPDTKGFRTVEYAVLLTFRNLQGRVTKVENFIARESLPADFKKVR